jgi:uncharacterized protein (TIGR02996 family)
MTKADLPSLLQSVLGNPDQDIPRLAYADACASSGDEVLARFIRLQIDAFRKRRAGHSDAYLPSSEARDLSDKYGDGWAGPIRDRVQWLNFHRGFVEEIKIDAQRFLETADELYKMAPIRKLWLTGVKPVFEHLMQSPHLKRIVALCLEFQQLADADVKVLAMSPNLGKLALLGLRGNDVTVAGVEILAASTTLPSLKQVDFTGNPANVVKEIVSNDILSPDVVFASGSEEAYRIEQIYGRKTWLHTVEDHGLRIPLMIAEC